MNGTLFVVATPIGNLEDLTPRARQTLADVSLIAAEDTRHTARLLMHIGCKTRLLALHDHNEERAVGDIVEMLQAGASVALVSDAGTPLVSDPGFRLVRAARAARAARRLAGRGRAAPTHAQRRRPSSEDFGVQAHRMAEGEGIDISDECLAVGKMALQALGRRILHARVDLVEVDGEPRLMEFELIEPSQSLRGSPKAIEAMARAIDGLARAGEM